MHNSISKKNDTKRFTCSYGPQKQRQDCVQLYNISSSKPWYSREGHDQYRYLVTQFDRTIKISKIKIQHAQTGWINKIDLFLMNSTSESYYQPANLSNGPANAWNTITINPPIVINAIQIQLDYFNGLHPPKNLPSPAYGIRQLRFYGDNVKKGIFFSF